MSSWARRLRSARRPRRLDCESGSGDAATSRRLGRCWTLHSSVYEDEHVNLVEAAQAEVEAKLHG